MNMPGSSIFQGADTLKVNSTLERQEEEELEEDQKRRAEELGNLLENAFDDLDDGNDSTIDSTTNHESDILPEKRLPPLSIPEHQYMPQQFTPQQHMPQQLTPQQHMQQQLSPQQQNNYEMEMHKMKMMLESKSHEIHNINQVATEATKKCDEYQKRLTITQAELERALREKQNTHELLVESKEKCSHLDSTIGKLRNEKKALEAENTQLVGQLETVQNMLADAQRKYDMVERDLHKRDDRNAELRIRQLEEHQRAKVELLQQQFNQVTDQLEKKKQELEQIHTRYNALQSNHESMLVDKVAKINELNNALDIAQSRCNQLAAKPDYEAEYMRQQKCIADLHKQLAGMEQTIATLNERVNGTTAELDVMDTLLQQHQADESPSRGLSQAQSRFVGSTPLNTADRMGQIKAEVYRAVASARQRREEVRKLEKQLEERQQEVRKLREHENKSLVELATLKEDKVRLETRLKLLEEDLKEEQHKSLNKSRVHSLQIELDELLEERNALKQQCTTQTIERKRIDDQLKNVEVDLEELKQEHDNLKRNYEQLVEDNRQLRTRASVDNLRLELERHKILLKDAQSEVERLKKLYADVVNDKESVCYQLQKLSETDSVKELQEKREQLASLQRTLKLAELKSEELTKILETEKLCHERELQALREKCGREKLDELKAAKENANTCSKCMDYLAEITKAEIQLLKLNNLNALQRKEIDELKDELKQSQKVLLESEEKMQLLSKQDRLIEELKVKASQFEDYIKSQSSHSEQSSKQSASSKPETVSSSEMLPAAEPTATMASSPVSPALTKERIKRIEQRVRDEMAKLFAMELKRFTSRLQQTEEKSLCLQREYQMVCSELQQRQNEVELLKQTILAEREKIEEVFGEKDGSFQTALEKQKNMLQKCRTELHAKNQRIAELTHELEERQAAIESERQSMKAVMTQWEAQRLTVDQVEQEWREKLQKLRDAHEEATRAAQIRYQSAKRTAHNYKIYAEDKEAHMKREYERIKQEYELSLAKIELTLNQRLEHKSRELLQAQAQQMTTAAPKNQLRQSQQRDKENQPSNK